MPSAAHALPPVLHEGEFLRRWEAMPELQRAELIDGVVSIPARVSGRHGVCHSLLEYWLGRYAEETECCDVLLSGTWLMRGDNAPQPDLALRRLPEFGGQSFVEGEFPAGAPELIVEIAETGERERSAKLRLYERSGVREYVTVRPRLRQIVWRELIRRKFREAAPGDQGWFRSRAFPGLWLDPAALWSANRKALGAVVQVGAAARRK